MFNKVLIANRGEIAVRIVRACRRLGIASVVAYSEADRDSRAVQLADEAICVGPPESRRSYLNAPALLSAALLSGSEAIHPGYGFLSEDDTFAEMTRAHGLAFIGPPPEVLERFASKAGTRSLLARHGLPTIPGSGMLRDDAQALSEAEGIGYPVLIKPSAGGGGKGMRMVRSPRELQQAMTVCRSEALAAFGDDSLYLEKWLEENRHVEVQVIVDRFGNGVHVGERDCSVQRRHQKILEEAPTPALDPGRREALAEQAVQAVIAAGYENLGTLEFLLDREGNYYFIEINCRIQVEHPVTEMLSGLDLVVEQIRIAAGEPLGYGQGDVVMRGHAIEFRINAEDTEHDFRPQAGVVENYLPPGGPGVRMDSHMYSGYEVPPYYDSLLGKLVVWGPDRATAIARSRVALDELIVTGIVTNIPLHRALLEHRTFLDGEFTTNLLDRVGSGAFWPPPRRHDKEIDELTDAAADAVADVLRREGVLLNARDIQRLIPHRWPVLMVDRIVEYDPARSYIRGEKGVTSSEWFFQGHFPGLPVMPGVLQIEALAQTMAVYVAQQEGFGDRIGLFAGIEDCRFKRVVQPGDRLSLEVTMEKLGKRFGRGRAVASVDGEVCCEATISFIIPSAAALG